MMNHGSILAFDFIFDVIANVNTIVIAFPFFFLVHVFIFNINYDAYVLSCLLKYTFNIKVV